MTWKLDITNSILLLVHFGQKLLLHGVTFLVPDLSIHTGDWLCYVAKFITYYLSLYTMTHSLVVSILKYVLQRIVVKSASKSWPSAGHVV